MIQRFFFHVYRDGTGQDIGLQDVTVLHASHMSSSSSFSSPSSSSSSPTSLQPRLSLPASTTVPFSRGKSSRPKIKINQIPKTCQSSALPSRPVACFFTLIVYCQHVDVLHSADGRWQMADGRRVSCLLCKCKHGGFFPSRPRYLS